MTNARDRDAERGLPQTPLAKKLGITPGVEVFLAGAPASDVIRELALPLGLVDVKICSVNDVWSGLKLVVRKELR